MYYTLAMYFAISSVIYYTAHVLLICESTAHKIYVLILATFMKMMNLYQTAFYLKFNSTTNPSLEFAVSITGVVVVTAPITLAPPKAATTDVTLKVCCKIKKKVNNNYCTFFFYN